MGYASTGTGRLCRIGMGAMAAMIALASVAAARPLPTAATPFAALLRDFLAAERDFDRARLEELITPDYVEVSPIGEVDERERMLGFYAPANRRAGPPIVLDEVTARIVDDAATVTARLSYSMTGGPARAMRGGFAFKRVRGDWKIAFAQYTPIRPAKP